MKRVNLFLRLLLIVFVIVFGVSFFTKNRLVQINDIHAATFKDPIQTAITKSPTINFKSGDYQYITSPLFDYKITGVVVSKHDYNPSDDNIEKPIRYDLCIVWGQNVKDKIYLSSKLSFSQGNRFCNYNYSEPVSFDTNQISNNHLVTINDVILDRIKSINTGDEVTVSGKLINMTASGNYNDDTAPHGMSWSTSTIRTDTGAGACEVILVDSVDVLTSVHETDSTVNMYSLLAIAGVMAIFVLELIAAFFYIKPKTKSPGGFIH